MTSLLACTSFQEFQKTQNLTPKPEEKLGYVRVKNICGLLNRIPIERCGELIYLPLGGNQLAALVLFQNIEWFPIEKLPCHRNDMTPKSKLGLAPNKFFMAIPFIRYVYFLNCKTVLGAAISGLFVFNE